ncbi:hypothetical protein THAOC_33013 [Thalassiosira oceanica]|uniref:AAA+ ATPase domain-containing protein n=1 Tax=Thalassiosira oceanica TaxID=159749 RepID=K0R4W6_THAOC|nr:hypothetical protein THAOC_33013 [Thalassiosira oceanica]|eukprot:EJK48208.1 hypothetical protein THAOC_33013 [Thalassiosira oceanica]
MTAAACRRGVGPLRSSSIYSSHAHVRRSWYHATACSPTRRRAMSLADVYERRVGEGCLQFDPLQKVAISKLDKLQSALDNYNHSEFLAKLAKLAKLRENERSIASKSRDTSKPSAISADASKASSLSSSSKVAAATPLLHDLRLPRGFYIHGPVGSGKSLLLDLFHQNSSISSCKKRRLHFHAFLQDIHKRIHAVNKKLLDNHGRSFHVDTCRSRNPILLVAQEVSSEITLLFLDEFQVTDVADAMILKQFFDELWRRGVVVIATSNRPPEKLYEGGLNRSFFLPFIDRLRRYCVVHRMGDESDSTDYRRVKAGIDHLKSGFAESHFFVGPEAATRIDGLFLSCMESYDEQQRGLELEIGFGRTVSIERYVSNKIARFTFDELCKAELGSNEYHAIANHFQIVVIENIPQLSLEFPDQARRSEIMPDDLFVVRREGIHVSSTDEETLSRPNSNNILAVDAAQSQGKPLSALASVRELAFAFKRAESRLVELTSFAFWKEKGHTGS